jgi:Tfp pilus assembly protein PilF
MKLIVYKKNLPRWSVIGSIFCVLSLSIAVQAAAYTPASDQTVLTVLPSFLQINSAEIRSFKARLQTEPPSVEASTGLARVYIELGRREADPRYYGYAEALLIPWWTATDPPAEVLLLRALLRQHQHQYAAALQDLQQLVKQQADSSQAWLSLAVVQWVQGDYAAAQRSCRSLAAVSTWYGSICFSQVLSLTGEAGRAYQLQLSLLPTLQQATPELAQWVQTNLAEIAWRLGRLAIAEQHFRKALAIERQDHYLLRVYSDFLLSQQRSTEVIRLLKDKTTDDALLLRLALASQQAQQTEATQVYQQQLQARYLAANLRKSKVHQRDEAWYLLSFTQQYQRALELAQANWSEQKEAEDTALLLRAALANQDFTTARKVQMWLKQNRQQDTRLDDLLAQIPKERAS